MTSPTFAGVPALALPRPAAFALRVAVPVGVAGFVAAAPAGRCAVALIPEPPALVLPAALGALVMFVCV